MGLPPSARTIHAAAVPGVHKPDATSVPEWAVRSSGDPLSGLAEQRRQAGLQHRQLSQLGERDVKWLQQVIDLSSHCSASTFFPDYQPVR